MGDDVDFERFKQVYVKAWEEGAKGCTTFRLSGKRFGVLQTVEEEEEGDGPTQEATEEVREEQGEATACFWDPVTGQRECS